jgi:opacity protein-like surface antigen
MKKLVIAAVAAAALNTTASAESYASNFSGFYAGVQAGINSAHSKSTTKNGPTNGAQSFLGGLFAGYGVGIGSYTYIGWDTYVNFHDTNIKYNSGSPVNYTARNNLNFGVKVRLGHTFSPQSMIFLGLGAEYAKWRLKCDRDFPTTTFAPSVGTDLFITKNIFARAEYTYVVPVSVDLAEPNSVNHNINLHRFTLGLGCKF